MAFSCSDDEIGPWNTQIPRLERVQGMRRLRKETKKEGSGERRSRKGTGKRAFQAKLLDLMEGFQTQSCLEEKYLPIRLFSESPLPRLLTLSPVPLSQSPCKKLSHCKPIPSLHPRPYSTLLLFPTDCAKPHKAPRQPLRLPSLLQGASQGSTVLAGRPLCGAQQGHPVLEALERRLDRILSEKRHKGNRSVL